jgi:IS5 family transposase
MQPKELRDSAQNDFFRARLEQIVDMGHPLAQLAATIDWRFWRSGSVQSIRTSRAIRRCRPGTWRGFRSSSHTHNLSDKELCARWVENPYYQLFCGEEFFHHELPFDRSSLTRWRQRMGEEKLIALIRESLSAATPTGAAKPSDGQARPDRLPALRPRQAA